VRHGIVTEDIVRGSDRTAEVSRGRSSRHSDEGGNDRKGKECLGLDEGSALAIPLRRAIGGQGAVKPQRMLTEGRLGGEWATTPPMPILYCEAFSSSASSSLTRSAACPRTE
jgi:hypothetical protein